LLLSGAILLRRRYPLAAYGFLIFLVCLAPTSSFIPIHDVFVERRLYLPFIGLLLVMLEPLRRLNGAPKTLAFLLAGICLVTSYMTWQRSHVWASVIALWEDSAAKSPDKPRARIGLGNAYIHEHRCGDAAREYEAASRLGGSDFTLKYNLATAYECLHRPEQASTLLREAIAENPDAAPSYALLGKVSAEKREWKEGLTSLQRAVELDPNYAPAHAYLGVILTDLGRPDLAGPEFEACLRIDPGNALARQGRASLNRDP
jgi:tetratricopeptide (TPR) repeat protein